MHYFWVETLASATVACMIFLCRPVLAALLTLSCAWAYAATLTGEVVALADGDTLTVLDDAKTQYRVRLAGIDAPEKHQAFGGRSQQHLSNLAFGKRVVVEWHKTDRYRRIVGKVTVGQIDAGLEQLRAGMAWHYKQYEAEQSAEDRAAYAAAEQAARQARLGVWSEDGAVAPWDFRRRGSLNVTYPQASP